jgi:hypothetical protein
MGPQISIKNLGDPHLVGLQVWPAPDATVDELKKGAWTANGRREKTNVRQPFAMRDLEATVQRPWDGHASAEGGGERIG